MTNRRAGQRVGQSPQGSDEEKDTFLKTLSLHYAGVDVLRITSASLLSKPRFLTPLS